MQGSTQSDDSDELPPITGYDSDSTGSWIIFGNGGALKYTVDDGVVFEEIYAPSDPRSVMERSKIGEQMQELDGYIDEARQMYEQYDTRGELMRDWETLAEWITHE